MSDWKERWIDAYEDLVGEYMEHRGMTEEQARRVVEDDEVHHNSVTDHALAPLIDRADAMRKEAKGE